MKYTGCFFRKVPPQKVLSVEDGKSLPKKWKSELKLNILLLKRPTFTFLVGILPSSTLRTFWGGTIRKKHPVSLTQTETKRVFFGDESYPWPEVVWWHQNPEQMDQSENLDNDHSQRKDVQLGLIWRPKQDPQFGHSKSKKALFSILEFILHLFL